MKRDEMGFLVVAVWLMALGVLIGLTGCGTLETKRNPNDAGDIAQEAGCPPLPVCEIPPEANAKQLQSALWACVLEYRALYSQCTHLVKPVKVPKVTPGTGYGMAYCHTTNPERCMDDKGRPL
jgi:hypothetical protein